MDTGTVPMSFVHHTSHGPASSGPAKPAGVEPRGSHKSPPTTPQGEEQRPPEVPRADEQRLPPPDPVEQPTVTRTLDEIFESDEVQKVFENFKGWCLDEEEYNWVLRVHARRGLTWRDKFGIIERTRNVELINEAKRALYTEDAPWIPGDMPPYDNYSAFAFHHRYLQLWSLHPDNQKLTGFSLESYLVHGLGRGHLVPRDQKKPPQPLQRENPKPGFPWAPSAPLPMPLGSLPPPETVFETGFLPPIP